MAARARETGVEVFAELAGSGCVADRDGGGVGAANALVGYRHRRTCAADGGVVGRSTTSEDDVELLVGDVLEIAAQVQDLPGERCQRAGTGGVEDHREVTAVGSRAAGVVVGGGDPAAREACVADVAAVGSGLDGAAQRRTGGAAVADLVIVGVAANAHVAERQRRVRRIAAGDAGAADHLLDVAAGDDLTAAGNTGTPVEGVAAAGAGVGVVAVDRQVAGTEVQRCPGSTHHQGSLRLGAIGQVHRARAVDL
ncbi:MAG: hypothetical protein AW07_01052 [Candidatus Accumulibacter sp. SK-11]|nr:MAG: hypothetical protein AW07_01052 [Candidatus Accumulibacter sp. SK-11]